MALPQRTEGSAVRVASHIVKAVAGTVIVAAALGPIVWMVNVVFADPGEALSLEPRLWPTSLSAGLGNIQTVLSDGVFLGSLVNSLTYTTVEVVVALAVCSLAAFEFAHGQFRGKRFLFAGALVGLMIPLAVTVLPAQRVVAGLGWLNTVQGVAIPAAASSFGVFILTSYMKDVPFELIEAATMDGLSRFGTFWRIALPLCRSGVLAVGILLAIASWSNYLWPLVVAIDPGRYPVSVAVASYFSTRSHQTTGVVLAAALLASLPLVVIYILMQRFIVDSIARAGIRG